MITFGPRPKPWPLPDCSCWILEAENREEVAARLLVLFVVVEALLELVHPAAKGGERRGGRGTTTAQQGPLVSLQRGLERGRRREHPLLQQLQNELRSEPLAVR